MSNNKNDDLYVDDELTAAFMDDDTNQPMPDQKEDDRDWVESRQVGIDGQLPIDVYEIENKLVVKCPTPGISRENLEVDLVDNVLTIKGVSVNDDVDNESYHIQECYWGEFSRTINLPFPVVSDKIEATLVNGLLTIVFIKNNKESVQKIRVQ